MHSKTAKSVAKKLANGKSATFQLHNHMLVELFDKIPLLLELQLIEYPPSGDFSNYFGIWKTNDGRKIRIGCNNYTYAYGYGVAEYFSD